MSMYKQEFSTDFSFDTGEVLVYFSVAILSRIKDHRTNLLKNMCILENMMWYVNEKRQNRLIRAVVNRRTLSLDGIADVDAGTDEAMTARVINQ